MAELVPLRNTDDRRDVIHRACEKLREGKLIAFPTDTVYVAAASALISSGVERLRALSAGSSEVLLLKSGDEVRDYVTSLPKIGKKLAKRCWPGPLIMQFPADTVQGLFRELPETTQQLLFGAEQQVAMRVSQQPVITNIQLLSPAPLVISTDTPGLRTAEDVQRVWGDQVDFILDDGPCRYGEPATVARIAADNWQVTMPGVVSERTLSRLSCDVYLFVCTGNTCRSPMAEALFRHHLAARLGCDEEALIDHGHLVVSAGLAAAIGAPASSESVKILSAEGIDLSTHESQPLTDRLLDHVDQVYTMTRDHRAAILSERPDLASLVNLLSVEQTDISDPIGGGQAEYQTCKIEIERSVHAVLDRILPSTTPSK